MMGRVVDLVDRAVQEAQVALLVALEVLVDGRVGVEDERSHVA